MGVIIEPLDNVVDRIVQRVVGIREVFFGNNMSDSHVIFRKCGIDLSVEEEKVVRESVKSRMDAPKS